MVSVCPVKPSLMSRSRVMSESMVSRVVPATSETIDRSRLLNLLNREDLPTLGRQTKATLVATYNEIVCDQKREKEKAISV